MTDDSTPKTRGKGMALIGIAFSIGFIVGPIIGAVFSIWGKERADNWFVYPAYCALTLSLIDLVYIAVFFEETLPEKQRLKSLSAALKQGWSWPHENWIFRHSNSFTVMFEGLSRFQYPYSHIPWFEANSVLLSLSLLEG